MKNPGPRSNSVPIPMFSSAVAATAALLLRRLPRLRGGAPRTALSTRCLAAGFSTDAAQSHDGSSSYSISAREIAPDEVQGSSQSLLAPPPPPPSKSNPWVEQPEYMQWKRKEKEILEDIDDIVCLTKEILHSNKYRDGERLNAEDEKEVTEKLLAYHPHSEDKIGCGLDSIMVDRHPEFRNSRCLFVVRTDGVWIDFSYQKCLRAYIREKYPAHSEKFIREHFKRT